MPWNQLVNFYAPAFQHVSILINHFNKVISLIALPYIALY